MTFHELRTRRSGARQFADVHVLVPGEHSVREAHRRATDIEQAVRPPALPATEMVVHVEPLEGHHATSTATHCNGHAAPGRGLTKHRSQASALPPCRPPVGRATLPRERSILLAGKVLLPSDLG